MKKYICILACFISMSICCSQAQSFRYDYGKSVVILEPTFDNFSHVGKKVGLISFDKDYFKDIINKNAVKYLPREVLTKLSEESGAFRIQYFISKTGNILYMRFILNKELLELMTEKQLVDIYDNYKETKFDMNKADLEFQYVKYGDFDYGKITIFVYRP